MMDPSHGQPWTILPHGHFRVRVLAALIQHQWFIRLRWVFVTLAFLLLVIEHVTNGTTSPTKAIWIAVGVLALVNLLWMGVGRGIGVNVRSPPENIGSGLSACGSHAQAGPEAFIRPAVVFVNAQMIVDIFLLTVILRYSGGIENPMAVFYLFHMLIAALLLKPLNALFQGAWALALFAGLGIGECLGWISPHYPFVAVAGHAFPHTDWVYVITSIGVLAAGIVGTLYFTLQISSRLDEQEDELFRANEALHRSREALERLQERRSRFMQTAAHQLKTPVTGIETLATLIRDGVVGPEGVSDIIERIIKRSRDAIIQVTELLTLARVEEASSHRHETVVTPIEDVLLRLIARFGEQARAKGLRFEADIGSARRAFVAVDSRDLEDCIGNLLDNAIKYTPDGGQVVLTASFAHGSAGSLTRRLLPGGSRITQRSPVSRQGSPSRNNQTVRLSVRDTGIGIAPESHESIFEPFHRGNEALASNISGSGLGLTIVRAVAEQAEGTIEVRSEPGVGSEFILILPAAPDRHAAC